MPSYPGKRQAEKAVTPLARKAAERIVSGQVIDAVGWWYLRQFATRAELVELKVASRSRSYVHEAKVEELFGKPVEKLTPEEVARWVGVGR